MTEKNSDHSSGKKIVKVVDVSGRFSPRSDKVLASITVNGDANALRAECVSAWSVLQGYCSKGLTQCLLEQGEHKATIHLPMDCPTFRDQVTHIANAPSTAGN